MTSSTPLRGLPPSARRCIMLACAALFCLLPVTAAQADSSTSLTVVGTSDVFDSGLIQNVIQPAFLAAYPQYTFKYIGTATGTAITDAETGVNTPSVLIVHAASLENQFVANGYSYEKYGRAIWYNDFVFAGPTGDPAGVGANASNNIVQAFADVAAAGIGGGATPPVTFVSRGGTPGTTVEEHAIWAMVQSSGLAPAGLDLCTVSAADGGGMTPVTAASGLGGQPCSAGGLPPSSALPPWYVTTGLTQGPNVVAANACTVGHAANSCYVLTDRGTFDYLNSGLDPAGTIPGLKILTRGPQPASAPGGVDFLINYFHAYIINPTKCTVCSVNLTAAQDFLNLITSPAVQAELKFYLDDGTTVTAPYSIDPVGAPFVADASPAISASGYPTGKLAANKSVTLTGSVTNAEPGYPALSSDTVTVDQVVAGVDVPVPGATATTSSTGTYSVTFVPPGSGDYQVTTGQIAQIENSSLNPVFGDLLSPGASTAAYVSVAAVPATTVGFKKVGAKKGKVTVTGKLAPGPFTPGAKVELLAMKATGSRLKEVAKTSVGVGKTGFTIRTKLKRKQRWILQLEYVQKGKTSVFSTLKLLNVK